jgi:undecaprenyl pyrophosphate phosphatase UppP
VKKITLLIIVAAVAIFVDGTLTHDIFDYRIDSFSKWATIFLIIGILLTLAWSKNGKNKTSLPNNKNKFMCF